MFLENFESGKNEFFDGYLHRFFFTRMKKGDKFALISLKSVALVEKKRMALTLENPEKWSEKILSCTSKEREKYAKIVGNSGYGICTQAKNMERFYLESVK